jgi:pSer/pThr/pTyr-binding forkhead associated (FHA) protein
VLTDLESTNGTKVNNEDIQLRILRFGDIISVGRSVILYGSRDQIAGRLSKLRGESEGTINPEESKGPNRKASPFDFDLNWNADSDLQATLYAFEPPEIPDRLTPGQAAQLAEVLDYLHIRIRNLLNSAQVEPKADRVVIDSRQWQSLLDLQSRLAEYLRCVSDPNASNG